MQNNGNNCNPGFVSLDGSWGSGNWNCGYCGCNNCGCDRCSNCGCNNGCGSVVCTNARRNRSSDDYDSSCRSDTCTRHTRSSDCECGDRYRPGDCGCNNATYGNRNLYVECCDDNTGVRDLSAGCDGCSGTAYVQRSSCDKCGGCSGMTYTRQSSSGCDKGNGTTYNRSRKNKGVGMVWAAKQELDQIFESESALRSGTLFPELHKPMNGYCPGGCNCQTDEQAAAFAAWELRLYLNTHPNDKQALALFRKLCREADDPNYATSFLKDVECASGWDWTDDPWPWECRPCGR